jgi:hypothetical protein
MVMPTDTLPAKPQKTDRKFLLSEMLGAKVILREKKIGSLSDLMIVETGKLPEVRNFVITRPFGDPSLLIPYERMVNLEPQQLVIDVDDLKKFETSPPDDAILLRDHILDKKVLDTEDAEVEVVYDIRLVERNAKLYVTEVDTSKSARLRRLGFGFLSEFLAPMDDPDDSGSISWMYIQPLPSHISSFKGDVKLEVLKETLADIHPVDLADILEELDHDQRVAARDKFRIRRIVRQVAPPGCRRPQERDAADDPHYRQIQKPARALVDGFDLLDNKVDQSTGTIRTSLFAATDAAEVPDAVAVQLAEIFSVDIDFHRELRRGDRFVVVYEMLSAGSAPPAAQ